MIKIKNSYFRRIFSIIILFGILNITKGNIISNDIRLNNNQLFDTFNNQGNNFNSNLGNLNNFSVDSNSIIDQFGLNNNGLGNENIANTNNVNSIWPSLLPNFPNFPNFPSNLPNNFPINFLNNFPFTPINPNNQHVPTTGLFANNKIPLYSSDISIINGFFKETPIKNAKLCYRGSQNNFLGTSFHQKCHNKSNTITIVHNQFGKKIGAFTPTKWNKNGIAWLSDGNSKIKSFIFSITNNQKFINKNNEHSMYSVGDWGPIIGSGMEFQIYNKLNNKIQGTCQLPNSKNFINSQFSSIQNFSGTKTFKINEYQVYQIQFV